jgi:hypothetical protein
MMGLTLMWSAVTLITIWAVAALYVDLRIAWLRVPMAALYTLGVIAILLTVKPRVRAMVWSLAGFCLVLLWWSTLRPSNDRDWKPNNSRTAWAEIDGDSVRIHNLRNCDYKTETEYQNCWSDRTVHLLQIRGVDLFQTNWGSRWISHPILSFQFGDNEHIAFSIEARYQAGQSYSAVLGFFRQYELIFVTADERDVIRLRTNYREGEEVYLYRARLPQDTTRRMFLTYIGYLNRLKDQPEWYNALTRNCTTTLDRQLAAEVSNPLRRTYQILLNGTLDELLFDRDRLVTGGLPFAVLKEQAHINTAARAADRSPDFSAHIRAGRIGF